MTDEQRKVCLRAIDHFGVTTQTWKLIEEIGELLTEIAREHTGRGDKTAIREELADTTVMCEQMRIIYGGRDVDAWIENKLERLERRIDGGTYGNV
jgi:NTP pyrophosphatase (non-canonical NTP hydrolase)